MICVDCKRKPIIIGFGEICVRQKSPPALFSPLASNFFQLAAASVMRRRWDVHNHLACDGRELLLNHMVMHHMIRSLLLCCRNGPATVTI